MPSKDNVVWCENILSFTIEGMMCMKNCGTTVEAALNSLIPTSETEKDDENSCNDSIRFARVDFESSTAHVLLKHTYNSRDRDSLVSNCISSIQDVGFEATFISPSVYNVGVHLKVEGMMCMKNCGSTVIRALTAFLSPLVNSHLIKVNVPLNSVVVLLKNPATRFSVEDATEAIEDVGFDASVFTEISEVLNEEKPKKDVVVASSAVVVDISNDTEADPSFPRAFFNVGGMSCASCVNSIESVVSEIDGVASVKVGLIAQKAEVAYNPNVLVSNPQDIISKCITNAGYEASYSHTAQAGDDAKTTLNIKFDNNNAHLNISEIRTSIKNLDGVTEVDMNIEKEYCRAVVTLDINSVSGARDICDCISPRLHPVVVLPSSSDSNSSIASAGALEVKKWRKLLRTSLCFMIPAMLIHMVFPLILPSLDMALMNTMVLNDNISLKVLLMWGLATPVQFGIGKRFYVAAYKGATHGMFGMDFLIVTGTTASYAYSMVSLILGILTPDYKHGHYFFESSTMLLTFVTLGKYLESVAKGRTVDALDKLSQLQPKVAILVSGDKEREIPITLVQRGDILKVYPGASVPTDGCIVSSSASKVTIDESMLTGESLPVVKSIGDLVFGSTINQKNTTFCYKSKSSGVSSSDTLSQICSLVEDAQVNKAPIQAYADYIASIFAPVVLVLSILTFITWNILLANGYVVRENIEHDESNFLFCLLFSISVVVIACPCALGLATPTAVMVGCGVGASNGILIKGGGSSLETANAVDTIVFDKTGTLTMGILSVTNVIVDIENENISTSQFLYYIGSAENQSEHPLGKAIVSCVANQEGVAISNNVSDFKAVPGCGLECKVDETSSVVIGTPDWLATSSFSNLPHIPLKATKMMNEMECEGKTVVCVAIDNVFAGLVAMADIPRPEAHAVVKHLLSNSYDVWMITGDNLRTASAIARRMGINHVRACALPKDKVGQIKALQSSGKTVAMVGDGINDAPALATADVGIAIGAGTEIAVATADMILVKSNLKDVVTAFDLSKVVFSRIRLNFAFSMGYNLIGIPVAAGVFYPIFHQTLPPACAGLAMAFSSVSVVISSLMLKSYRPPNISLKAKKKLEHPLSSRVLEKLPIVVKPLKYERIKDVNE